MNLDFHRKFAFPRRHAGLLWALAGVISIAQFSPSVFAAAAKEPAALPENPGESGALRTSIVKNGVLYTKDGLTLRLNTDLGTVNITQLKAGAAPVVTYTVRIETDAHGAAAQQLLNNYALKANKTTWGVEITGSLPPQSRRSGNAQFSVQYEVVIPRNYSVDVSTAIGDITTGDIGGTATLHTQGGNIIAGKIGGLGLHEVSRHPAARLETEGGKIQVLNVAGDLSAFTAGGHIHVGDIAGDASLHSGGGHIRAGKIGGRAELDTAGGNITVVRAEHLVNVHTGGGQIDFGEVRGSVRAQTGGGGIRVLYVSGPMEVESNAGSICLTRVADAVQASTSGGTITAWINPEAATGSGTVRLSGASQLASGSGDIIVFLPRNLAATIEAIVVNGNEHQIEADGAVHLAFQASNGNGPLRAQATLNGGGTPLKLRTTGGKIKLQYLDSQWALRQKLFNDEMNRLAQVSFSREDVERLVSAIPQPPQPPPPDDSSGKLDIDIWDRWMNNLQETFRGGIEENQDDFLRWLTYQAEPSYPALAQRAGIHGLVELQAKINKDGRVEVLKVLKGEPVLVDAAIDAVKRWRAKPPWLNGRNVAVISTITFDFQLQPKK